MKTTLIPARGTVEFLVFTLDDDPQPDIVIHGPDRWFRPVVGLVAKGWATDDADDPLRDLLPYDPVVVDETGELWAVYDYLHEVMGSLHWDHCTHFYRPHIDGPIEDAPRVHYSVEPEPESGGEDPFDLSRLRLRCQHCAAAAPA
jgi:hypothetical protein